VILRSTIGRIGSMGMSIDIPECFLHDTQKRSAANSTGRLRDECLNETLFASLPQARAELDAGVPTTTECAHIRRSPTRTPEEFRAQHIAVAANAGSGQNFTQAPAPPLEGTY
jgi:hypothetical protein